MSDLFDEPDGATPLNPDEGEGLRLSWVQTRSELNAVEAANIERGARWAFRRRKADILNEDFIRRLHKNMFSDVWSWAGEFRTTGKNIGVDSSIIGIELRKLLDDVKYWIAAETYPPDEIAMRFHHRLVKIHLFPNGNGRHARLMADLLALTLGEEPFSWGAKTYRDTDDARQAYLNALCTADKNFDVAPLIAFARS